MNNIVYDYVIVGQGIAGTLMAYFLKQHGLKVLIIDDNHAGSSSMVAAGIVNPITGKNFVKSWRVDEFLPVARQVYDEMAVDLGIKTYTMANVIRALDTIGDENIYLGRTADITVADYVASKYDIAEFEGKVNPPLAYGELKSTFYVHFKSIIAGYKSKWEQEGCYLNEKFDYKKLMVHPAQFTYDTLSFNHIIFCEGYQSLSNPFFPEIRLAPAKGEVLLVKIPNAGFKKIYKDKVFIVHQYDDVYWVGSGYEWDSPDDLPTEKAYLTISKEITRILKIPFEIIDHQAAIRPTMHTRRPVFLLHTDVKGMYMFNGLGTKGASVGPFAAKQFSNYLVNGNDEDLILKG